MRIVPQVQPEMPEIVGRIDGLRLRAQDHFIHDMLIILALDLLENLVEVARCHFLALGQIETHGLEEFAEAADLLFRRFRMHAIEQGDFALLERFGR